MIEQRGGVHFLWAEKMEAKDIHNEMLPMYGEHCLSRQAVHNWVQEFSEGRTSIEDEHRAGRLVEIATPETLQRVEDIIRAERRVTIDACHILHDSDEILCRHSPEATRPPHQRGVAAA